MHIGVDYILLKMYKLILYNKMAKICNKVHSFFFFCILKTYKQNCCDGSKVM